MLKIDVPELTFTFTIFVFYSFIDLAHPLNELKDLANHGARNMRHAFHALTKNGDVLKRKRKKMKQVDRLFIARDSSSSVQRLPKVRGKNVSIFFPLYLSSIVPQFLSKSIRIRMIATIRERVGIVGDTNCSVKRAEVRGR